MSRKKTSVPRNVPDDEYLEVGYLCHHADVEMHTPRARRQSPSEPCTPTKDASAKTSRLGSPLVTPKLDRKKTKYRFNNLPVIDLSQSEFSLHDEDDVRGNFLSPGFTLEELAAIADSVRRGRSDVKWPRAEAEEDEQLLRRFDLEAMYGPSVGLSRAERWKRALMMGLNPPLDVMSALKRSPQNASVFDQRLDPNKPDAH